MNVFVYIITELRGEYLKVGLAQNSKTRLAQLQVGNARTLSLEYELECQNLDMARRVECAAHKNLRGKWQGGEWFKATVDEALAAVILASENPAPARKRKFTPHKYAPKSVRGRQLWASMEAQANGG